VVGCFRSGTTLLANLLGEHQDIANWSEANYIWDPRWYPWRPSNRGQWPLEFDPVAFTARWWEQARPQQAQIRACFGAYQWLRGRRCFLNKSPFNTFRIPQLLEMFPESRFIHMIRDGRAVAHSHSSKLRRQAKLREWPEAQQAAFQRDPDELLVWLSSFWKTSLLEVARQDEASGLTGAARLLVVRYEDLCADKRRTIEGICRFLGVDPIHFAPGADRVSITSRNHKWKELDSGVISRMVAAMEPMLSQAGYS
jgi:hypothetical protein